MHNGTIIGFICFYISYYSVRIIFCTATHWTQAPKIQNK